MVHRLLQHENFNVAYNVVHNMKATADILRQTGGLCCYESEIRKQT